MNGVELDGIIVSMSLNDLFRVRESSFDASNPCLICLVTLHRRRKCIQSVSALRHL